MFEKGIRELFEDEDRAQALRKAKEAEEKRKKDLLADKEKQAQALRDLEAATIRKRRREQTLRSKRAYIQSGVAYFVSEIAKRKKGKVELIWDEQRGLFGQRIIWERKQKGKIRPEHYEHIGSFFTPSRYWGRGIARFHAKTIEIIADGDFLEVRGRKTRRVGADNPERINSALGRAYRRPGKISRVEYAR